MIAHIRKSDGEEQTLKRHCCNVARLCAHFGAQLKLRCLMCLIGLIHDMGKGEEFERYIRWSVSHTGGPIPPSIAHPNHAPVGALFTYERWYRGKDIRRITAQIIALCVYGHHAGLPDCLEESGDSAFLRGIFDSRIQQSSQNTVAGFMREVADERTLDALFELACGEVRSFLRGAKRKPTSFDVGMITRLALSILVDSDRWDSACFEHDEDPFDFDDSPDWVELRTRLDSYCEQNFSIRSPLDEWRNQIAVDCTRGALLPSGVYRLTVPTGGGKTYSGLGYMLTHAATYKKRRIIFCIPFTTIIDQNAADIRKALDDYDSILEHHAGIVRETEKEQDQYKLLTERWDSDVILTSLVQFLNAIFRGENSRARRMHRLINSVIVFDEIQSLPPKCKHLFELAVMFLCDFCECSVVLCTATQPRLSLESSELANDVEALYDQLQRVRYHIEDEPARDFSGAGHEMYEIISSGRSVLAVVNTKQAAWSIYDRVWKLLKESGRKTANVGIEMTDGAILEYAEVLADDEVLCVHLSTLMCPQHRLDTIKHIRAFRQMNKTVFCASTALIEAGVNVSFPVVIRSLAGLPSIIQAAGRCNRNAELPFGDVRIWYLAQEKLSRLPEIRRAQAYTRIILDKYASCPQQLGSPKAINDYFLLENQDVERVADYPIDKDMTNDLVKLLKDNQVFQSCAAALESSPLPHLYRGLLQSFRTAGHLFEVIPDATRSVLVPYGAGKKLIEQLNGRHNLKEEQALLRRAQRYSVSLYDNVYKRLEQQGALHAVGDSGTVALDSRYYNSKGGVTVTAAEMEDMIF